MTKETKTDEVIDTLQEENEQLNQEINESNQTAKEQQVEMEMAHQALDDVQEKVDIAEEKSPLAGVSKSDFDQLTNKSQQFMMSLDRQLTDTLSYEIRSTAYNEMVETLLTGQQSGQTARHLYGTPTEVANNLKEKTFDQEEKEANQSPGWQIYVDGALLLGSLFTFLLGLSMANTENSDMHYFGVLTMIINYLISGLVMYLTAKNMPNPDAPKGEKGYPKYFLASIGSMFLWFVAVSGSGAILPAIINPILPPHWYMIIAVITFLIRILFKRHYNVQGGLF